MSRPFFLGYEATQGFDERWVRGSRFEMNGDDLVRHAFVCGATGAGKTVFAKSVVEEALVSGVPVVAIDVKGDLVSMALARARMTDADFDQLFGEDGAAVRSEFDDGLQGHRAARERVESFARDVEVRIFSPRGVYGQQLALAALPSFAGPVTDEDDGPDRRTLIQALVLGLGVRMYGARADKTRGEELKLLEELVGWCADHGHDLQGEAGVKHIGALVANPPFPDVGGMPVEEFLPEKRRTALRRKLAALVTGAERDAFKGVPLSIDALVKPGADGRTPLSIIYLGHLHEFQLQSFVVGQICGELYRWIRTVGGSKELRALFYMDEVGGGEGRHAFYPSAPYNPPSKGPLALLVKQGRSAGLGVLLATQNPVSVDVRALGNMGTWAAGQLTRKNDQDRVRPVFEEHGGGRAAKLLAHAPTGHFLVNGPGMRVPVWVHERWLASIHRTLAPDQVRQVWRWLQSLPSARLPPSVPPPPPLRTPASVPGSGADGDRGAASGGDTLETSDLDSGAVRTQDTAFLPVGPWVVSVDGQVHRLAEGQSLTIGRSRRCDVVLSDQFVSSEHVHLQVADGLLVATPLRPKNPPRIGGRVMEVATTVDGEQGPVRLTCGRTVIELLRE